MSIRNGFIKIVILAFTLPIYLSAFDGLKKSSQDFTDASYFGVGEWDADSLGNHRVVLKVSEKGDAIWAHIPWRRRDAHPEEKLVIVVDASTGERITNVRCIRIERAYGDVVFQPKTAPGEYHVYYMSYITSGRSAYPTVTYRKPEETADEAWLIRHDLTDDRLSAEAWKNLPRAELVQFQSIDAFNSFYPMEVIATPDEMEALFDEYADGNYFLFPEDRRYPIRMTEDLPFTWIKDGQGKTFEGDACRGEYYAFQVGVYAARADIEDLDVRFTGLKNSEGETVVPASEFTCFNTGGIDWVGRPMDKVVSVKRGKVQALWMGVQIPMSLNPGRYESDVTVAPVGLEAKTVRLVLDVSDRVLVDAGDSEPWRHSRLRWLNSRVAEDDEIVPPFTPMEVSRKTVACLGRKVYLNDDGFLKQIQSFFDLEMTRLTKDPINVLTAPVRLVVEDAQGNTLEWKSRSFKITKQTQGAVAWEAKSEASSLAMDCHAQMEFDGNIEFEVALSASEDIHIKDIRLEIQMNKKVARYMMGMGYKGGYRPESFAWTWDVEKNQDGVWVGDVNAGLQCSFKDENYSRPLNTNFYQLKPLNMPPSWYNEGKGGFRLEETNGKTVMLTSFSGERILRKSEELHFNFRIALTPFKLLDTRAHWTNRYYHRFSPVDTIASLGANTINVHHATDINPYINYPFMRPKEMKAYIDEAHDKGMKMKIYYTVRELSNIAPELFALFSLGDEILSSGPGGGFSWLQEHLDQDYIAGWLVPRLKDAAVINSGVSRWHNYYLEGLNWLVKNVGIDGLYIDDVAFDRTVMKRLRKILDRNRDGALVDLHSANQYNPRDGFANSANLYLEHFPYINRLWFGEYFDYNAQPDFWLVEMSGIPFGLMGEMLQDGGNPWRGMIFGMTSRLPWAGDPRPIWKVWDEFGIHDSRMIGYWVPSRPVTSGCRDVLTTAYVKEGKTLVAVASWAEEAVEVTLAIDWEALGLDPDSAVMDAPAVQDFQEVRRFQPQDTIPMTPGKGWLLIIHENP